MTNPHQGAGLRQHDVVEGPAGALRALPVQLIEADDGLVLKRGVTTLRIRGEGSAEAVHAVLEAIAAGRDRREIRQSFAEPHREMVDDLVDHLLARRILVAGDAGVTEEDQAERGLDVFYWNFDEQADLVAERVGAGRITILGVNEVSRRLAGALEAGGVTDFDVVDYLLLRNVDVFGPRETVADERWGQPDHAPVSYDTWAEVAGTEPSRCIVATSDFGATPAIRQWNSACIENGWHFLPVILQDLVGWIGPLVIPGQTACYECLRARQNSHMEEPESQRAPEAEAFANQAVLGFHPSMASVLGDLAAMELLKFYGRLPAWRVGNVIEVNLMAPSVTVRKVLKVPRCTACGAMTTHSSTNLHVSLYRLNE